MIGRLKDAGVLMASARNRSVVLEVSQRRAARSVGHNRSRGSRERASLRGTTTPQALQLNHKGRRGDRDTGSEIYKFGEKKIDEEKEEYTLFTLGTRTIGPRVAEAARRRPRAGHRPRRQPGDGLRPTAPIDHGEHAVAREGAGMTIVAALTQWTWMFPCVRTPVAV